MDEVGRGPMAGPLVAAAVVLPSDLDLPARDSKKLSDSRRRELARTVREEALGIGLGKVDNVELDSLGLTSSVELAFTRAAGALEMDVGLYLVDGRPLANLGLKSRFVVGGDDKSLSIACASIVAKVARDDMMIEADSLYPGYGFSSHKGYCTRDHMRALRNRGPCPIHRRSFGPIRSLAQLELEL